MANDFADSRAHAEHMANLYSQKLDITHYAIEVTNLGFPDYDGWYLITDINPFEAELAELIEAAAMLLGR